MGLIQKIKDSHEEYIRCKKICSEIIFFPGDIKCYESIKGYEVEIVPTPNPNGFWARVYRERSGFSGDTFFCSYMPDETTLNSKEARTWLLNSDIEAIVDAKIASGGISAIGLPVRRKK